MHIGDNMNADDYAALHDDSTASDPVPDSWWDYWPEIVGLCVCAVGPTVIARIWG
jgi:hypothetical protein